MYSSLVLWLHGDFESNWQYDGCVCVQSFNAILCVLCLLPFKHLHSIIRAHLYNWANRQKCRPKRKSPSCRADFNSDWVHAHLSSCQQLLVAYTVYTTEHFQFHTCTTGMNTEEKHENNFINLNIMYISSSVFPLTSGENCVCPVKLGENCVCSAKSGENCVQSLQFVLSHLLFRLFICILSQRNTFTAEMRGSKVKV